MGACDISFELNGQKSQQDVLNEFKARQREDASRNGHQDGYSGDFQTVHKVEFHDKTFDSENEAMEYCLSKAEKFTSVVAVKYKLSKQYKPDAKFKRLEAKIMEAAKKVSVAESACHVAVKALYASKAFVTCGGCKSRLNTEHLKNSSLCRVCHFDLTPLKAKRGMDKARAKYHEASAVLKAHVKVLQAKAGEPDTQWLIAGWGAS